MMLCTWGVGPGCLLHSICCVCVFVSVCDSLHVCVCVCVSLRVCVCVCGMIGFAPGRSEKYCTSSRCVLVYIYTHTHTSVGDTTRNMSTLHTLYTYSHANGKW